MHTPSLARVGPLLALLLGACAPAASAPQPDPAAPAPRICTKIGCESGLAVVLEGTPQGSYRVEARAAGETARVRECASPQDCAQIFFADFLREEVTVEVIAGGKRSSRTVRPEVETVEPNGPGCPPTCRQARVTVPWPG
jgi:hypothetical protein